MTVIQPKPRGHNSYEERRKRSNALAEKVLDANKALRGEGLVALEDTSVRLDQDISSQRRRGNRRLEQDVEYVSLVERNGVYFWETGLTHALGHERRRGRRGIRIFDGVAAHFKFKKVRNSRVLDFLLDIDRSLAPGFETTPLREVSASGELGSGLAMPVSEGDVLLLIHGTFQNAEGFLENIIQNEHGKAFLEKASEQYTQILAFDHPTLHVSPSLNGSDLAKHFRNSRANVDIVCHSRGGLVTRWFLEHFDKTDRQRRVVFVGSPFVGTSLASPSRSRALLDLMANLGLVFGIASSSVPFLTVASGLVRLFASVTKLTSTFAVPDMLIGMVPGLSAMSRLDLTLEAADNGVQQIKPIDAKEGPISLNPELRRLNEYCQRERFEQLRSDDGQWPYHLVTSEFQPKAGELSWNLWKTFVGMKDVALDQLADKVIFTSANDLVVDTDSMGVHTNFPAEVAHHFKKSDRVHHLSYFSQAKTYEAIRNAFRF